MKKYLIAFFAFFPLCAYAATQNGTNNVADLGKLIGVVNNNANNNLLLGTGAGGSLTSGTNNTALGYPALSLDTSGGWNVAIGSNSLIANTTATDNIAVGDSTLKVNTTGYENTAIGSGAMKTNVTGAQNTAIGGFALFASTGSNLTAVGDAALGSCTTCPNSTAVGYAAGTALTTGSANTAVGHDALFTDVTGTDNTAMGNISLLLATGTGNTAIGSGAGQTVSTGTNNTILGYGADVSTGAATNRIAIGQGVSATTNNTAYIGNSSITDVHFGNDSAILHGNGSALTGVTPAGTVLRLYSNPANGGNGADNTEDTIFSYSMPANTMAASGDKLRIRAHCQWANNADTKTTNIYFGATKIAFMGAGTTANYAGNFDLLVNKIGSNSQTENGTLLESTINSTAVASTGSYVSTSSETDTSIIIVKITGQSGSSVANDVVCNQFTIEFIPH